ncbi:hypothetical protein LF1_10790 [Rubripirellula obstinata]|uniref:Peptidylprolyl isomerase n=1 Tax=Rubripirellula obstinata TaxID=406547 RepID=A0A5B1CFQ7_9BACT|nr:hypothetical protein [Rubripirellula obstinata]KAA1258559.1 hypothetical protein LF1_10790 [Rubripirellula obstinata]
MIFVSRFFATACALLSISTAIAEEKFGPDDPVAAVDGKPVFLGELNLILRPMARGRSIDELPIDVQRAAAVVLVRRHLALRALRQKGGSVVETAVDRYVTEKTKELERIGSSAGEIASKQSANQESLLRSWAWEAAWNLYVKTRLTEKNLRRFYDQNVSAGDPTFDELTDQAKLRRDATNALFDALVATQADVKVQWFIPALRPPVDVQVVPSK